MTVNDCAIDGIDTKSDDLPREFDARMAKSQKTDMFQAAAGWEKAKKNLKRPNGVHQWGISWRLK